MLKLAAFAVTALLLAGCGAHPVTGSTLSARMAGTTATGVRSAVTAPKSALFLAIDTNRDGFVSATELLNGPFGRSATQAPDLVGEQRQVAFVIAAFDLDNDRRLAATEFDRYEAHLGTNAAPTPNTPVTRFGALDINQDGVLSLPELMVANVGQPAGGWTASQHEASVRQSLLAADANRNGVLSFAEFEAFSGN